MSDTKTITLRPSSAVTVATTEYGGTDKADILSSTATATTANKLVDSAGGFVALGVAVGDIIKNTTTGYFALVTAIDSATTLSIDADIMANTNTYKIISGKGYKFQKGYKQLQVLLDLTAAADAANDTLDVYIDTSPDGGLTWFNIGHFTQLLGNGGAKKYVMALSADNPGATAVADVTSDAAAGATRQWGFSDRIRYRGITAITGTESFTYSLKALLK